MFLNITAQKHNNFAEMNITSQACVAERPALSQIVNTQQSERRTV